ncbi:MAG: histidine--tRNA ligase [Candidatus Omnitrophica bacterium]|nr:histidine--tRNA ligase [Candidatus Omnitrophota bacterium]
MFKKIPGTRDILPDHVSSWQGIEDVSRRLFSLYNYKEIRPPLIEEAGLFNRSLGDAAEIVQKQMFLIQKAEDVYALRPEGTASIVRAYVENNLDKTAGFEKFFYIGPMFRMERPQKGRLRQFHHIGCEAIGSRAPELDVEVISMADNLLRAFSIEGYTIVINSLGCAEDRKHFGGFLKDALNDHLPALCEDCRVRYGRNILRILDCKNEGCKAIVNNLSLQNAHLCDVCRDDFEQVRNGLKVLGVNHEVSPCLVRGLDYYTGTVFEIKHPTLGPQQDALGAGGRYDNLVKELGGPETGAIGFALGVERLLLAAQNPPVRPAAKLVYIIPLGEDARQHGIILLHTLRKNNISADTDYESRSLKGAMRRANDLKACYVLIIGDDELKKNTVMCKDMAAGKQEEIPETGLVEYLTR